MEQGAEAALKSARSALAARDEKLRGMARQLEGTRAELDQARKAAPKQAPQPPRLKAVKEEEEFVDESPRAARVNSLVYYYPA